MVSGTVFDQVKGRLPVGFDFIGEQTVLPFINLSRDPEQEYFGDAMTEDVIISLSKRSGLCVIARNSVFTYKGRAVQPEQVSRELGVRSVLEGSVRMAGLK